jgi:hypothetical protein
MESMQFSSVVRWNLSRRSSSVLLAAALLTSSAQAQITLSELGYVVDFEGEPAMEVVEGAQPSGEAKAETPGFKGERLKKLDYDRRASTILKSWSTPLKENEPAKDASGGGTTEDAAPAGELKTGALESLSGSGVAAINTGAGFSVTRVRSGVGATGFVRAVPLVPAAGTTTSAPPSTSSASSTSSGAASPQATGTAAPSSSTAGTPAVAALPATGVPAAGGAPSSAQGAVPAEGVATPPAADAASSPEDAAKAAEAAAIAQRDAEEKAAREKAEREAFEKAVVALQRDVTLGNWSAVKALFDTLEAVDHKAGYGQLLLSLMSGPKQRPQVPQQGMPYVEKNVFAPADVVGLAALRRGDLDKDNLQRLGSILSQALASGHQIETFLDSVRPSLDEEGAPFSRRSLAHVLVHAGLPFHLEGLLPTLEEAREKDDRDGLNLLSRFFLARFEEDKKTEWLEQAWHATQAVLAVGEVDEAAKAEALTRAVDIAPKIREELGSRWLDESFSSRPERGMEILATIGAATSTKLAAEPMNSERRLKLLELQSTATKALLAAAPQLADQWKRELEVLADAWLREALFTYQNDDSTSLGPRQERDVYGNFFYYDYNMSRRGNMPTPLRTDKVLETRPSDDWLARIDPTLQPRFQMIFAQLLLKVGEEGLAFPYIESLARTLPTQAEALVAEFLRVWIANHDPNAASRRQNRYVYFFGFEERASGIPLTRSKQDRNLRELGEWVTRLRTLGVEIDKEQLAQAFKTAHSSAEVYRLGTVEQIFGPMETLDPEMLAGLVQTMRANLLEVWRDPALQKEKQTGRKQQDIEAEVKRGYELARGTLGKALDKHPSDWRLWLAQAAIEHDENNYAASLKKDTQFSARRDSAFETFAKAADMYAGSLDKLDPEKESTEVYEYWFYAALGACDLKAIEPKHVLAAAQITAIEERLAALPKERAERHLSKFASTLFSRMSNANPGVKFRYAREGLAIVGDHKLARDVKSVYDYYTDLVTEIQLVTSIDGSTRVGHGQPFGLRVDLRHTREIERESGGFGKYLQNQNNQSYSFNYGRPTEDYRDKFEESAREALKEHFDVLSVTFNQPKAHSIADAEYGWRRTPYAYILVKPRGPQVDRVPSLKLDLDFLDTSGYAVLPVESSTLAIDASAPSGDVRPHERLALTQTLDERQAKDGKLLVEVKVTALGLVPEFDELLKFAPAGFSIASRDDQGVSVVKFDEEVDGIVTERLWTLTLLAADDAKELPEQLAFPAPRGEVASNEHFRYVDADLASVGPVVELERRYGEPRRPWALWIAGLAGAVGVAGFLALRGRRKPEELAQPRFRVPENATAFNVLGLLREIHANNGLAPQERSELEQEIATLEQRFFAADGEGAADLRQVAQRWASRTR